ncbi:UNVERIFIED_CONTAM: hypothetical protein GTU68_027840 [Idotea baltica]|nr:hypothetical protein [Idotea baltica]
MNLANGVAEKLLVVKAVIIRPDQPFTWASGIKSPIYCDNRILLSYPSVRNYIKNALVTKANQLNSFDVVAGVATAGIAHGMLLADAMDLPYIYIRSKAKEHGRQNLIEGHLSPGSRVLVIEDLISTGGSSIKAVEAVRAAGAQVMGVLSIFTYGLSESTERFAAADCSHYSLSDYNTLLDVATEHGYIDAQHLHSLNQWRLNPSDWAII